MLPLPVPTNLVATKPEVFPGPAQDPRAALERARCSLELKLAESEDWRALKQLEAREAAGEWFDVIESDVLRDRLTVAVAAAPEFMAWQFIDAALGCLDAGAQATTPISNTTAIAAARPDGPTLPPPDAAAQPVRELAQRIPTLLAIAGRPAARPAAAQLVAPTAPDLGLAVGPSPVDLAQNALSLALIGAVHSAEEQAAAAAARDADDLEATRFATAATGIEEAEVQIIVRRPATSLIDTRLPPSPLTERGAAHGLHPRVHRAPTLNSADPAADRDDDDADWRPRASALDEAHVAIIPTSMQSGARSRAERRALGVAPERERHMRRFLKALAGE